MATVTGFTAPRMLEIENNTVVDGTVDENGHLKLTTHGGEVIDAGKVKGDKGEPGASGPAGPASSPNPEPIAVSSLTVSSNTAFYTAAGQPVSTVVFDWPIPILDVLGDTPAIDGYELWYRLPVVAEPTRLAAVETNTATVTAMEPGVEYRVKVRAHTFQGQWGAFSSEINVIPAVPSDAVPQEPGDATIVSNVGSYRPDGRAEAILHFTWDAVIDSTTYAPLGIRTYEIWLTTDGAASPMLQTPETEVYLSFPSGSLVDLKVRAMSNFGIWGDFSASDSVTTAFPAPNNNPTTIPTLTTNMGVVYSNWDGALSTGPAGPEFQHLITEVAPAVGGPWTAIGIPAVSAGNTAVIPSTPGANVSVRFRWRDKLGRLSSGISPVASITVLGIEQTDLTPDLSDVIDQLETAVVSVITEYAVNASETVPPVSGWSTATPARTPGTFVWMRTTTNYADSTSTTSSPVLITGNTGASGGTGTPGRGISSTAVTYQVHTNGTTAPTGTWVASPPATSPGQFLWTRTITTYTDATTSTAYSVAAHGATGATGAPGVGVSSTAVTYQVHSNGTTAPTGTWTASPSATAPGQFLWTRTVTTYTDASTTTAYSVAAHGATGATGSTGAAGKGISSTVVEYQIGSSGTTAPTGTWVSTPPATTTGQFLWTRTTITYTDASTVPVYSVSAHGATGATGSTGSTGAAGTDATNVVVGNDAAAFPTDPAGNTSNAYVVTIPFSGWIGNARAAATIVASGLPTGITAGTNTPATTGADGSLILNVASGSSLGGTNIGEITLTITCNSKTFVKKFSWSKAPQGATGSTGSTGSTGAAGRGISSTVVEYQAAVSGTVAPTGTWVTTPPAVTPGQYLWTRTTITYTDAGTSVGYSVALQGATGSTGSTGATGKGISSTVVTYQADASGTVVPTGTWVSSPPATTPGQYLWTRTVITYTDAATTTSYAISKHGDTGATGVAATSIDVGNEAVVIPTDASGNTIGASTITIPFTGYVGTTRAAATVVVSGLPTGITVQTNTAGTSGAAGSLVLAVASGSSLGGTAFGNITLTITCNALTFVQTFTWSKAIAGATGATGSTGSTGAAGVDATNVVVGNDAVALPTDPAGNTSSSFVVTIPFSGWIGNTRAAATIAASGLPSGITAGTNTAATSGADGSLLLNVASGSSLGGTSIGEITLTLVCNSKTFIKKFSWSKAPQGATGSTGSTGAAGKGVSSTVVDYQASASGTVAPVGTWVSSPPAVTPGQYLWTRTVITYTDASSSTGYSVALQGATGATGSTGGTGPAGKGISTTVVTYQANASGTVVPSGTWVSSPPATTPGQYLWTRTVITYTDATSTTAYAISKHGDTGATGSTGSTGSAGVPATAIDVGNEAVVIPCTSAGATVASSTITIPFTGYVGNARAAATVVVSGLPTGITVSTNTAGTSGAAGSLVLSVASGSTLGGTNNGNITLTITCNSLTFVQTFTWSKAIAGATGATGSTGGTGAAGVDATNVIVGNDAVAIPTDPAGATATSYAFTVPFSGWIGNTRAAATIAATGLPTGITAGTNTAATGSADGSLILNVASGSTIGGTTYGEITLTVTCNGKAFPHKFTWTKAPQGATGATGSTGGTGSAGVSATSIDVGNEAVVIPCTSAGATTGASTITIPFTGFVGATRAATTVAVSGLPTGITVQTNTAGTSGAAGSLVLAVASASTLGGAASGNITLTITCNSIVFVQLFSWTKGVAGATGSTGGTGAAGKGVSSVTPYYLQNGTGVGTPAAPTTNPPGGSWVITEPGYLASTELYRAELFVFTDATFGWTSVSKVSAYTASTQAMTAANLADAAAHGMVKASQTDPGHSVGRIWLVLNASSQVIGIKISNGSAWSSYVLMADQILVPSSVGTVSIADGAVNAPKVNAGSIWADEAWLDVLRVGKIEASMVTSSFESELTLENNSAINTIITTQSAHATQIDAVETDLGDTNADVATLATGLGTVGGTADAAKTAALAAQAAADAAQDSIAYTQTWFRVDSTGAHVGQSGSPFQTHIYPDRFAITDNGIETTTWSSGKMSVKIVEALQQIMVGKHQLEPYPNPLVATPTGTIIRSIS